MIRILQLVALVFVGLSGLQPAVASQVILQITGVVEQVSDASNLLSPSVAVGTPFTALLTYDPDVADSMPDDEHIGNYVQTPPASFSITVAGHSFATTMTSGFAIRIRNDSSDVIEGDSVSFSSSDFAGPVVFDLQSVSFFLGDNGASAFSSDVLPSSFNANAYSERWIQISGSSAATPELGPGSLTIRFRLDSFSVVPEPTSMLLMGIGAIFVVVISPAVRTRSRTD